MKGESATVRHSSEERIVARGLNPPGPLLIVKRKMSELGSRRLRIIVSVREAADEIASYFTGLRAGVTIDRAGDDFHVVVDLDGFEKEE